MENYRILLDDSDSIKVLVSRPQKGDTGAKGTACIRINASNYYMLERFSRASGVSIGKLASACIDYCFKNDKIVLMEV